MSIFSFGEIRHQDGDKYGLPYNTVRLRFGSPLVKPDMKLDTSYGSWYLYKTPVEPVIGSFHLSKAVSLVIDGKVIQENDVYVNHLDDTTSARMEINLVYDWDNNHIMAGANIGKVDRRTIRPRIDNAAMTGSENKTMLSLIENSVKQATGSYIKGRQYPTYRWEVIDLPQIDSVLKFWKLSRFDTK